jgi:hypothetical protein
MKPINDVEKVTGMKGTKGNETPIRFPVGSILDYISL